MFTIGACTLSWFGLHHFCGALAETPSWLGWAVNVWLFCQRIMHHMFACVVAYLVACFCFCFLVLCCQYVAYIVRWWDAIAGFVRQLGIVAAQL